MLYFRDFVPKMMHGAQEDEYESFGQALEAANAWMKEHRVKPINVETVVLPNMWNPGEEGTVDGELSTSSQVSTTWHQFLRIWFQR